MHAYDDIDVLSQAVEGARGASAILTKILRSYLHYFEFLNLRRRTITLLGMIY